MPDSVTGTGSVTDDLRAAWTARENGTDTGAATEAGSTGVDTTSTAAEVSTETGPIIDATGRAHAQDGKFTSKPGETSPAEASQADPAAQPAADQPKPAQAAQQPPAIEPIDPPVHWDKASKEAFSKVSPEVQRLWVDQQRRMDAAHTQRSQELAEKTRSHEGLLKILEPRRAQAAMEGTTLEAQIQGVFSLVDAAKQNPAEFAKWFVQSFRLAPETVYGIQQQPNGQPAADMDPRFATLERQLQQANAQIQTLTGHLTTREQQTQRQSEDSVLRQVDAFRNEKDATGAYAYPHYDAVEDLMADLIPRIRQANPQAGYADVLKTAYDQAVMANPDTRAVVLGAQQRKQEADRAAQERARADEAKRKATSITGSPGGSSAPAQFASVQDELRHHFANLGNSGRL